LAPLWPGYTFPYELDSSRANFGSIFAYAHMIKVLASSFHNVSLTSIGVATKAIINELNYLPVMTGAKSLPW
jgi:hypothetical protein